MIKVRNVDVLPGHRLALEFSDATTGIADLSDHVKRKPFLPLRSEKVFGTAKVEHGAVEWPEAEVGIATEALYALVHRLSKPRTLEEARGNELEVSLRELRRIVGMTQNEVAASGQVTQGALSSFESAPDHKITALRTYLRRLGFDMEIVAVSGDRRFRLKGI
jgi:hypothetical protein